MTLNTRQTTIMYFVAFAISLVHIQLASSANINSSPSERVKRRSYYNPWSTANRVSLYDASRVYRPPTYTIPRPYYIPVYGNQGRPMIFYPPQPLYLNPGVPQDNPIYPPYRGPTYLPPKESPRLPDVSKPMPPKEVPVTTMKVPVTTAQATGTTTSPKIGDRLGDMDEDNMQDFDDPNAPVWGGGMGAGTSNGGTAGASNGGAAGASNGGMTGMALSGDTNKESGPVPTRAPMTRPTTPPLVHNAEASAEFIVQPPQALIPAQRPRPPPPPPSLRTTTASPALGPSNCVWAIISCCSAGNPSVLPQNCFEQRGCPGPFWGASPCESDYARAAIAAAVKYYNSPRNNLGK